MVKGKKDGVLDRLSGKKMQLLESKKDIERQEQKLFNLRQGSERTAFKFTYEQSSA